MAEIMYHFPSVSTSSYARWRWLGQIFWSSRQSLNVVWNQILSGGILPSIRLVWERGRIEYTHVKHGTDAQTIPGRRDSFTASHEGSSVVSRVSCLPLKIPNDNLRNRLIARFDWYLIYYIHLPQAYPKSMSVLSCKEKIDSNLVTLFLDLNLKFRWAWHFRCTAEADVHHAGSIWNCIFGRRVAGTVQ